MKQRNPSMPGALTDQERVERMIRVNHAGEYGAKRIYAGQLAVLGKSASAPVIREMEEQEQKHLDVFSQMVATRRVRPTALMPLWHMAGYALGAATALMGEKAAMACTMAVESVIDEHYASQEKELSAMDEKELEATVSQFREEEKEHHDIAQEHMQQGEKENAPFYDILTAAIVYQTKVAIWLSTRI
jgi:3-demethoxyubiquinol 3-hydroxylase